MSDSNGKLIGLLLGVGLTFSASDAKSSIDDFDAEKEVFVPQAAQSILLDYEEFNFTNAGCGNSCCGNGSCSCK